jgi:HSP20 family protein
MTLVKTNYKPVQRSFNNLFEDFFNELPAVWGNAYSQSGNNPPVNIVETADAYHLELSAPGRNKEDFKINIENGMLTIGFEKKDETPREDIRTVRREFTYQSFKRSFSLDDKIDTTQVQAKYENGLLKLLLPKKAELKESAKIVAVQ